MTGYLGPGPPLDKEGLVYIAVVSAPTQLGPTRQVRDYRIDRPEPVLDSVPDSVPDSEREMHIRQHQQRTAAYLVVREVVSVLENRSSGADTTS